MADDTTTEETTSEDTDATAAAIAEAKQEAIDARAEANEVKADADAEKTAAAIEKAEAAEERARIAEDKASAASKDFGEGKKYSDSYVKKLRDEAAKHRVKANEAEEARLKLEDESKSEAERKEERASNSEARALEAERKLNKINVAIEKKLPLELADRLIGSTEDELRADADKLLTQVNVSPAKGQGLDQGSRGAQGAKQSDMNSWLRQAGGFSTS